MSFRKFCSLHGIFLIPPRLAGGVRREVWEVQGRSRRKDRKKGKASAKKQGGIGKTRRDIRGIEGRDRIENVSGMKAYLHGPRDSVLLCYLLIVA